MSMKRVAMGQSAVLYVQQRNTTFEQNAYFPATLGTLGR